MTRVSIAPSFFDESLEVECFYVDALQTPAKLRFFSFTKVKEFILRAFGRNTQHIKSNAALTRKVDDLCSSYWNNCSSLLVFFSLFRNLHSICIDGISYFRAIVRFIFTVFLLLYKVSKKPRARRRRRRRRRRVCERKCVFTSKCWIQSSLKTYNKTS